MRTVSRARWHEASAHPSWNLVYSVTAKDFFDQIDIALQIAAVTRDLPVCELAHARGLPQPEMREDFVNRFWVNCDADYTRTFFVVQRDVSWIGRKFTGNMNFFRGRSSSDLAHQFACALRRSQNHLRIHAALESI